MPDKMLSIREVTDRLGVSRDTVVREIKRGRLTAFKPGRDWRVKESELDRYVAAGIFSPEAA